jgi:F-type H+-transporting ATPase subunit a
MSAGHDTFHHIRDSHVFELPEFVDRWFGRHVFALPSINVLGYEFQLTKYMVLQVLAGVLALLVFRGLAANIRSGKPASGRFWNFWEVIALFIRDQVVRPSIGEPHHHGHGDEHGHEHGHEVQGASSHGAVGAAKPHFADQFLPYIWTLFFYILFCNLLGAIPFLGAATAHTGVTGVLALSVLICTILAGSRQSGVAGFWKSLVPHMDLPGPIALFLIPMIWVIEAAGLLIKHLVLAIRLFANMMAGHVVIGVFLSFIAETANSGVWYLVTPASILGQLAIGALELFVAFLQAYVFSLLASMFIGAAVNPH